jgi:hypothetical protein
MEGAPAIAPTEQGRPSPPDGAPRLDTTVDPVLDDAHDHDAALRRLKRARLGRRVVLAVLVLFVLAGLFNLLGVRMATVNQEAGDYELSVRYPIIGRPGLGMSWQIEVTHQGGFEGPVELAVDSRYFAIFDENGLDPSPASETPAGDVVIWTFDQPEGDRLVVDFDARFTPTWSLTEEGRVELRDGDEVLAAVGFRTWMMP